MVRQRRHCAFGVLLHGIGLPRVQCGCGAQVVGEPIVGTLGEKPVEQRIRFRVVACRDQRLGESRDASRDRPGWSRVAGGTGGWHLA